MGRGSAVLGAVVLALAVAGCPPSLDRYRVSDDAAAPPPPADGGGPDVRPPPPDGGGPGDSGTDAGGGDSGGFDAGPPGPCDLAPTCTGGCPLPWLLASVEDLPGSQTCGGQVVRFSLSDRETFCVCPALKAGGRMPDLPFSVGFVPPSTVVVASEDDRAIAIDGNTDTIVWDEVFGGQPVDIFPIDTPTGDHKVAVASRNRGATDISRVYFYDAATGGTADVRMTNGGIGVGLGVRSMTLSPVDRTFLRALKVNGGYAAADVDPWNSIVYNSPPHTADRTGFYLATINSFYWDGDYRVAWTGLRTDLSPQESEVYNYRSTVVRVDNRVPLGEQCVENEDLLPHDVVCTFEHAVPSPFWDTDQFALCSHPGGRRIVRIRTIDQVCIPMAEQDDVFVSARFSKLAIALDDYWDAI